MFCTALKYGTSAALKKKDDEMTYSKSILRLASFLGRATKPSARIRRLIRLKGTRSEEQRQRNIRGTHNKDGKQTCRTAFSMNA